MSISYPSASSGGSAIATTVAVTTVLPSTTGDTILAANSNRTAGAMIINQSDRDLLIGFNLSPGNTSVTNNTLFRIPANGGNYDVPESFLGSIFGIVEAAASGNVKVIEPRK